MEFFSFRRQRLQTKLFFLCPNLLFNYRSYCFLFRKLKFWYNFLSVIFDYCSSVINDLIYPLFFYFFLRVIVKLFLWPICSSFSFFVLKICVSVSVFIWLRMCVHDKRYSCIVFPIQFPNKIWQSRMFLSSNLISAQRSEICFRTHILTFYLSRSHTLIS